jgi:hypothetical protein
MFNTPLALLIAFSLCAPPLLALAVSPVADNAPRLVIFPPWKDGLAMVRMSGGNPVGPVEAPMGVLAFAADAAAFDLNIRAAGAWAIIDGQAFARLCGAKILPPHEKQNT